MASELVRGCYFTDWSIYRPAPYTFGPEKIPVGLCTHIIYAFAALSSADFSAQPFDSWADVDLGNFNKTQALKQQQPGLKTLLSFGGWTMSQSGIFTQMASSPTGQANFIKTAWALANQYGFDGIDIDWEYPDASSKTQYTQFLQALKAAGNGKLVTGAVSAGTPTVEAGYDVPSLAKIFDYVFLMAYDFHGTWETVVGQEASYSETIAAVNLWLQLGLPKSKLVMGIGAYGRGWTVTGQCAPGVAGTPSPAFPITQQAGIAAYFELITINGQKIINTDDGPYLSGTVNGQTVCFGYENPQSVAKKMAAIKSLGIAGAFTWTIDFDDMNNGFPIHTAIKEGLAGGAAPPQPSPAPVSQTVAPPQNTPAPVQPVTQKPQNPQTAAPAPVPTQPAGGPCTSGLRADSNPAKYQQCVNGQWMVRDCPPGTVFDPSTGGFKFA